MADVNTGEEPALSTKRFPNLTTQDPPNGPKKQKLEDINNGKQASEPQQPPTENDVVLKENTEGEQEQKQEQEEQEQEEEHLNGKAVIDRKGKGILIEEDDDDDSDSDSGSDSDSDSGIADNLSDDSDFADDPLAEVDLENILPSRTRRRAIQPGAYIANDLPGEDSEESDDPDA